MKIRTLILTLALLATINWPASAQEAAEPNEITPQKAFEPKDHSRSLSLKGALEEGLRNNPDERVRDYDRELLNLSWTDTYEDFWYPNVSLFMRTDNTQGIDKWKTGNSGNTSPTTHTATGSMGLELGDYTLFNWGKDYLDYLSNRESYKRNKKIFDEARRELKHSIITQYFKNLLAKRKVQITKEQLRHASFIYRLGREKANLRKISKQEYYQARTEFLRAQNEHQKAKVDAEVEDEAFAYLLGDQLNTTYRLTDSLIYTKIRLPLRDAVRIGLTNAPEVLSAKVQMENGQRSYEKQLKENLPLPKFSVDLGTYTHSFSKDGSSKNYETLTGSKNIELVASINATWTLWGSGGFFNSRTTRSTLVNKQKYQRLYFDAKRNVESEARKIYHQIQTLERLIDITKMQSETSRKNFDVQLEKYMNGRNRFINLKHALEELKTNETYYEESLYSHIEQKIELAKLVGVEDFPGENFENNAKNITGGRKR